MVVEIHEDQPLPEPTTPTMQLSAQFITQLDYGGAASIHPARIDGGQLGWASFRVPHDWTAPVSVEIVFWPRFTVVNNLTVDYYAGACGEAYNTHTVTTLNAIPLILDIEYCFDALADAPAFWAALNPGDNVKIRVSVNLIRNLWAETVVVRYS